LYHIEYFSGVVFLLFLFYIAPKCRHYGIIDSKTVVKNKTIMKMLKYYGWIDEWMDGWNIKFKSLALVIVILQGLI